MTSKFAVTVMLLSILFCGMVDAAPQPEFRAIQIHHWIDGGLSPEQIDQTIKWAKEANINVLQFQVRRVGDAYYDSAYEPRATNIQGAADFDPLAYIIKKGHANGMQVYAWVNVYRVWTGKSNPANANHIVNKHPEWVNYNTAGATYAGEGVYLDPGAPGVREYTVKLVADILGKYDVDGVMLDLVRYPGREWGYSDAAVAAFNAKNGSTGKPAETDEKWCQWRRDRVTETVRAIYKEINRLKPWVNLSAATVVYGGCPEDFKKSDAYGYVFQDWRRWMEEGIIDINTPMNYKDPTNEKHIAMYTGWLNGMKKWSYKRQAACTISVSRGNLEGVVKQVLEARGKGLGIAGFAFSQGPEAAELATKLRAKVFTEPVPVPKLPWKPERKPAEPAK